MSTHRSPEHPPSQADTAAPAAPADPIAALEGYRPAEDELFGLGWVPYEDRWDGDGAMPRADVLFHGSLPALRRIHPRRWGEVMAPYDVRDRGRIALSVGLTIPELRVARAVLDALPPPAQALARAAVTAPTLRPAPEVAAPVRAPAKGRRPTRQVNVRLGEGEYDDLAAAAEIAGTSPTTLARWLLLAGSRRVLQEHAGVYGAVRSRS